MTGRSEPSPASGTANRMGAETEQIRWYVMTGYALDKRRGMSIAAQVEKIQRGAWFRPRGICPDIRQGLQRSKVSASQDAAAGVPIFLYPRAAVSGEGFPVAQQRGIIWYTTGLTKSPKRHTCTCRTRICRPSGRWLWHTNTTCRVSALRKWTWWRATRYVSLAASSRVWRATS